VLGELHDRDVFLEITQRRLGKLQKQSFADHLLQSYQPILVKITMQRRDFYAEYIKLFGKETIRAWRPRVVPPPAAPAKSRSAPSVPVPVLLTA
jgi:hypothetical protein